MDNIITNSNTSEVENNSKLDLLQSTFQSAPQQQIQHNQKNQQQQQQQNLKNINNYQNHNNKFKRWNGYSPSLNNFNNNNINNNNNNSFNNNIRNYSDQDLKKELELRSLELMKKEEEIMKLRSKLTTLSEQYTQELAICCHYSNSLSNLRKEVYQMKNQFLSKEEQYKKQIQDLQYKLYCEYQPIGKLRI
ncbi:hypothetical protein DDB_G0277469 [Dictyostelium discoideum AX4]|uniref:Uncharacterized protein n=1 Tax=Dictyostelium discoideum TaxID=44689 RepID=Q8MN44_DICDI|nr:hypothetical protein DDB_G0277469 [Dictyostelium discoideum AX4]EAL68697.1 hypothetical protein DDB_G0277469 [Dictyostelium discoideum AX4]|eukprot:XP_642665.1 hypothetical protein DDB_G0277469 [Dictyostelium discoideum AX4]